MSLGKYNKLAVALAGIVITILVQRYGATNEWVQYVILGLTAFGVYQAPNVEPPVKDSPVVEPTVVEPTLE